MEYEQLTQEYRDDHLAEAMYGREAEWFHYDFDRINFEKMLRSDVSKEVRADLQKRLRETIGQMRMVECVYAALKSQIVDDAAHRRAVKRADVKRALANDLSRKQ